MLEDVNPRILDTTIGEEMTDFVPNDEGTRKLVELSSYDTAGRGRTLDYSFSQVPVVPPFGKREIRCEQVVS